MKYCILAYLLLLVSCNNFEYSPNVAFDNDSPRDLNKKNLARLSAGNQDDTVKIALTGDTQRSYEQTQDFVNRLNGIPNVDFVFLDGDISDFGMLQEMKWVNDLYSKLKVPYLAVIGNHDSVANGENAFLNMYGALNYSFVFDSIKFVCYNTNSREARFNGRVPDLNWLQKEFVPEPSVKYFVAVSHVPPNDYDFDSNLFDAYGRILDQTPGFLASLNAHQHNRGVFYPYNDDKPYIVTNAIVNREFTLIKIIHGKLTYEFIPY